MINKIRTKMLNLRRLSLEKCLSRAIQTAFNNISSVRCYSTSTTILQEEVNFFSQHAKFWWDTSGPAAPLHCFNDLRVPFARDGLLNHKQVPMKARSGPHPLEGYKYVDVGCGAGIFAEALARIGADVTGIDANEELIKVAIEHAALDSSLAMKLRYLNLPVEEHTKDHMACYDALICSEVIEHIDNADFFVENCVKLVKPGGSLFFTTINRNWLAGFCTIFLAENVMNITPKGTHHYRLLIPPEKLEQMLTSYGCQIVKLQGSIYLPNGQWNWIPTTVFTYAMHAVKRYA